MLWQRILKFIGTFQVSTGLVQTYNDSTSISGKLCGKTLKGSSYNSTDKDLTVIFHSDGSVQDRGFSARYNVSYVKDIGWLSIFET